MLAIARREFAGAYRTGVGWVVLALFLLLCGLVVGTNTLRPGEPATLRGFFDTAQWLMLFVLPAVSMRLLSDELRTGSIESLTTAPVSDWHIVFGKYIGALAFLLSLLAPTLLYAGALELFSAPDYGPILAGYLGLILIGMVYLAVGLLMSSLTANQIVSFLATMFFFMLWYLATSTGAAWLGPPLDAWLYPANFAPRLADFAKGVIDTAHAVFFLALTAWFLGLTVVVMEFRRWR
ncbi:MAG: ABC transporter permease subunit [Phycisphaerales bacterium]|nr:ABC transporter permease subunit [Phycisphaerales bacterium]